MITITKIRNPGWWEADTESAWTHMKDAMKRDWEQTQHDFGAAGKPDLNQTIGDTVQQARGKEAIPPPGNPNYDEIELAYRFGYGARVQFGEDYASWDEDLEDFLRDEWEKLPENQRRTWMEDRAAVRYGWEFEP